MNRLKKIFALIFTVVLIIGCVPLGTATASAASSGWVGSWGSPAIESGVVVGSDSVFSQNGIHLRDYVPANSTVRTTVTPTLGGTKLRLKFSNIYGKETITLNEVTVAKTGKTDDEIRTDTLKQVTFNGGQTFVNIAAGSEIYSDEISFAAAAMEKISVSTYFKNSTPMYVVALYGGTSYLGSSLGNRTHKGTLTTVATKLNFTSNSITYNVLPFLTRVDVYSPGSYCVVLLGDSTVTNNSYLLLEEKLRANNIHNVGVIMSGIIGNSLLNDGHGLLGKVYGQALLTRADRDAFSIPGVKYVIAKVGDNDILHPMADSMKNIVPQVTVSQIIQGYKDLAMQARNANVQLYLCTRTPYKGYERNFLGSKDLTWTQAGEKKLLEINSWVKGTSRDYCGGCINLDAMRDPDDSTKLRSQMTTDGIHFSELGQIAFVDLLPESTYGVNREIRDISSVKGINPYVAPVAVTQAPTQNNTADTPTTSNNNDNTQPSSANTTAPVIPNIESTTMAPVSQETPSIGSANQIQIDNNEPNNTPGTVVNDHSSSVKQMVGFAILAVVAIAIIALAAVFLIKMDSPSGSPASRRTMGRTKQKSRI